MKIQDISINNYNKPRSRVIQRITFALRTLIASTAATTYISNHGDLTFYLLESGYIIDFILACFPPDEENILK